MIALSKERRLVNQNSIAIVGLGYVGLTLAVALARAGHQVYGIEVRGDVVDLTNEGKAHFSETGLEEALGSVVRSGRFKAFRTFMCPRAAITL